MEECRKMTKKCPIFIPRPAPVSHHTTCPPVNSRCKVSTTPYASCVDPRSDQQSSGGRNQRLEADAGAEMSISATRDQSKGYRFDPVIVRLRILAAPPTRLSDRQPRNRTPAPLCLRFCRREHKLICRSSAIGLLVFIPPDGIQCREDKLNEFYFNMNFHNYYFDSGGQKIFCEMIFCPGDLKSFCGKKLPHSRF